MTCLTFDVALGDVAHVVMAPGDRAGDITGDVADEADMSLVVGIGDGSFITRHSYGLSVRNQNS